MPLLSIASEQVAATAHNGVTVSHRDISVTITPLPVNAVITAVWPRYSVGTIGMTTYAPNLRDEYGCDWFGPGWGADGIADTTAALGGTLVWSASPASGWVEGDMDVVETFMFHRLDITYELYGDPVCASGYHWDAVANACVKDPSNPPGSAGAPVWDGACSDGAAALSWPAAAGATSYRVERSEDGGATWTARITTTAREYTDTALVVGRTYRYRVVAVNGEGESAPSAAVVVRPCFAGSDAALPGRCCDPADYHGFAPPETIYRNRTCGE